MAAEVHEAAGTRGERREIQQLRAGLTLSLDTRDFHAFRQAALGWSLEHQWIGSRPPHTTMSLVMTQSLQIADVQHAMGYSSQGNNPKGAFSVFVPLDQRAPMVLRGRPLGPVDMGLLRSRDAIELVCPAGARFLIISIPEDTVERFAATVWHKPHLSARPADRLRFPDPTHRLRFIDRCRDTLNDMRAQPGVLDDADNTTRFEEKLLESLLLEASVDSQSDSERNRYKVARRAYGYLRERIDDVPSIGELCAITGASYATLERGFRELYGMAPRAMISQLRLFRARSALLHPDPSTTVTGVALRWGYLELGRFAVLYRQRFGEAPRETLRRTRGEPFQLAERARGGSAAGIWMAGQGFARSG
jgi:AraC-like DNA-binding protein